MFLYLSQNFKIPRPVEPVTSLHSEPVNVVRGIRYITLLPLPTGVSVAYFRVCMTMGQRYSTEWLSSELGFLQIPVYRNTWEKVYIKLVQWQIQRIIAYMWHGKYGLLCFRKCVGHLFALRHNLWQLEVQVRLVLFNQ